MDDVTSMSFAGTLMALTHSILINLFIKLELNNFLLPPLLSINNNNNNNNNNNYNTNTINNNNDNNNNNKTFIKRPIPWVQRRYLQSQS